MWYKNHFAVEYKGAGQHKTLVEAFKQLQQYSGALENPPLLNENPTWLQNAHRKLDEAVFAAYGWPSDLSDDEILARLLELNLKRAGT